MVIETYPLYCLSSGKTKVQGRERSHTAEIAVPVPLVLLFASLFRQPCALDLQDSSWSIWLICIGLLFFIARDNAILQKQQNINRYVHAYFNDNEEVMMELESIALMFSDKNLKPTPIKDYCEYMKERKKEAKDKAKVGKRK